MASIISSLNRDAIYSSEELSSEMPGAGRFGSVVIPTALRPFMDGREVIET
jgi:hypothetical protein